MKQSKYDYLITIDDFWLSYIGMGRTPGRKDEYQEWELLSMVYITFNIILNGLRYIIVNQAENDCVKYPSCIPCDITAPTSCEFCNTPYVYLDI